MGGRNSNVNLHPRIANALTHIAGRVFEKLEHAFAPQTRHFFCILAFSFDFSFGISV